MQDFLQSHGLINRSTKRTIYIDLSKVLSVMSDLEEKYSEVRAQEDGLSQVLKEKEVQLKNVESKLAEAEGEKRTMGKMVLDLSRTCWERG